ETTLGRWASGRTDALIRLRDENESLLSFANLVEAFVLAGIRRTHGVSLQRVRRAISYVEDRLRVKRPLINERFKTNGVDLFVERFGKLVNASRQGQLAIRSA